MYMMRHTTRTERVKCHIAIEIFACAGAAISAGLFGPLHNEHGVATAGGQVERLSE